PLMRHRYIPRAPPPGRAHGNQSVSLIEVFQNQPDRKTHRLADFRNKLCAAVIIVGGFNGRDFELVLLRKGPFAAGGVDQRYSSGLTSLACLPSSDFSSPHRGSDGQNCEQCQSSKKTHHGLL